MNDTTIVRICRTREEAHASATGFYAHAQALSADEKRVKFSIEEDNDPITLKQRAFLHVAVFPQIAEQHTFPDGTRYTVEIWKEFWRKRFLPDRWVMRKAIKWDAELGVMVQAKRATPVRVRVSTEDLSIKQYSQHIDRVIDHAVAELGVVFRFIAEERDAVRYVAPARKVKQQQREVEAA